MEREEKRERIIEYIKGALGMLLSICVALLFLIFAPELNEYAVVGYIGVFLACAAANASVFVPASSTVIVMSAACVLSPLWCGVLGGLGAAAGEQVSYWFGRSGKVFVKDVAAVRKIEEKMQKSAFWVIFLFALIPNPVFDIAGAAAGLSRVGWVRYTCACILGKVPKMIAFAFWGVLLMNLVINLLEANPDFPMGDVLADALRGNVELISG